MFSLFRRLWSDQAFFLTALSQFVTAGVAVGSALASGSSTLVAVLAGIAVFGVHTSGSIAAAKVGAKNAAAAESPSQ